MLTYFETMRLLDIPRSALINLVKYHELETTFTMSRGGLEVPVVTTKSLIDYIFSHPEFIGSALENVLYIDDPEFRTCFIESMKVLMLYEKVSTFNDAIENLFSSEKEKPV